jgi:hypothetical protein
VPATEEEVAIGHGPVTEEEDAIGHGPDPFASLGVTRDAIAAAPPLGPSGAPLGVAPATEEEDATGHAPDPFASLGVTRDAIAALGVAPATEEEDATGEEPTMEPPTQEEVPFSHESSEPPTNVATTTAQRKDAGRTKPKPKPAGRKKRQPHAPPKPTSVTALELLDGAIRETQPTISGEEIAASIDSVAGAFGQMFIGLTTDLLSGVSQLAVHYRGARLGLLYAHTKAVHAQERRELHRTLVRLHVIVAPVLHAWAAVRDNRGEGLVDVILRILAWAAPSSDGAPPVCLVRDGRFQCEALNRLSDRFFERGLAYSIARVGSVLLLCQTVVLRVVGLYLDFLRAGMLARGGGDLAATLGIKEVVAAASRTSTTLSVSAFRLRSAVRERLAALAFPDAELLSAPPSHRREAAQHIRVIDSLPILGDAANDPVLVFALINGLYGTAQELVRLFPKLPLKERLPEAAMPSAYQFVSESHAWLDMARHRYDLQRWEVHPMGALERALVVTLTRSGLARAALA